MEVSGFQQAMKCIEAMDGQDEITRRSLWKAALRYRQRDVEAGSVGYGDNRARPRASPWEVTGVGERAEIQG